MKHFDFNGAGRALMFFLLGLVIYLLAARSFQNPPCSNGISIVNTPCATCPIQSGCPVLGEAR